MWSLSPRTNWTQLAQYEFALSPLDEQRRIAELLSELRKYQEALRDASSRIDILRDSLIKTRSLELVRRFGLRPLRSVVIGIQSGISPDARAENARDDEYGVLKVSAVGDWQFIQSENKAIDDQTFLSDLEVKSGDILATRANADPASVGRTCIVVETRPGLMLSDKTWRLQLASDDFGKVGIVAWTKSPIFRKYIHAHIGGTEAKNISQVRFLGGPFPACTASDFYEFSSEVESIVMSASSLTSQLERARDLFSLSLNQLLIANMRQDTLQELASH